MEYFNAFLCGGLLCALGQILIDRTKLTPAKILVCYVTAGVIFRWLRPLSVLGRLGGSWCHRSPHRVWLYPGNRGAGSGYSSTACWGLLSGEPPPRQAVWRPPSSSAFWPPCCSKPGQNTKKKRWSFSKLHRFFLLMRLPASPRPRPSVPPSGPSPLPAGRSGLSSIGCTPAGIPRPN